MTQTSSTTSVAPPVAGTSLWQDAWKRLRRNRLAVAGMFVAVFVVVAAGIGPPLLRLTTGSTYDYIPADSSLIRSFPPLTAPDGSFSWTHPMGTDIAGRDLLARVLLGGRISLMVGLISTLVSLIIGTTYGATAGYVGGRVDDVMMRIVDVLYSIPYMMVVIVLLAVFGSRSPLGQLTLLFLALGAVSWLTMARIVRGQVISLKNQEFVLAARATGVRPINIIARHLVPNVLGPVIVYATLTIPSVMLLEAFLSFLGLGVQAPYASWGSLAADGVQNIAVFPWQLIFPGLTMAVTLFSLNFVGDGLRDALDPANEEIVSADPQAPLLAVRDLRTWFDEDERIVKAVDGVSFQLRRGETLGIVGESGSGKSVTSLSVMRLVPSPPGRIVSGTIELNGVNLLGLSSREMRAVRGKRIAMIFQDPMTSLNPFMRVSDQLTEVTRLHLGHTARQAEEHAVRMLNLVGIPDAARRIREYPHQFSGGMRQRVMIAMALSCEPELLIADEPTTALDVTIQAQILELVARLRRETGTSVILITHDLGVVAGMTDRIMVMYAGKVFESAPTTELFARPANPYTRGLLLSVPNPTQPAGTPLYQIPGLPPDVSDLPPGCPFAPRCERAAAKCHQEFPPFVQVAPDHHSLCHFAHDVHAEPLAVRAQP